MFTENFVSTTHDGRPRGWVEVVTGSMFSGKTEELIRRLKRSRIANQKVVVFKPAIDTRYNNSELVSHDKSSLQAIPVEDAREMLNLAEDAEVVGIDEVQFFDNNVVDVVLALADKGKRVIIAGLDMNYKAEPFGAMPQILARAEFITKLHAICDKCGNIASFSHRLNTDKNEIQLGEKESYQALCRNCMNDERSN